ncbi:MAG: hypothetical protein AB1351_03925 [Thermoproteota archaeon]
MAVYNYFLSIQPSMLEYDMNYALIELKEQHPWLSNYHSKMPQQMVYANRLLRQLERLPRAGS